MPWDRDGISIKPHPELLKRTTKIRDLLVLHEERTLGPYSKSTIVNIQKNVGRLIVKNQVTDILEINYELLNKWKNCMQTQGKETTTINGYLSSVNCFLQYFGIRIEIPFVPNRKGREAKVAKSVWEVEKFEKLLETIPYLKYKTMAIFLNETSARIGSNSYKKGYPREGVLGLNWGNIDFEKGTFTIIGKKGKEYVRPLPILSEQYLRKLKESMSKVENDDPVFQSTPGRRLSYFGAYLIMRKYMSLVPGVRKEQKHFHAFRHTRGTIATKKFGIRRAQGILMHDNINSTLIYEHVNDEVDLMELIRPDKVQETRKDIEEKKCPICNGKVLPDRKLCDCGYDFAAHRCPKCGKNIDKEVTFCGYCGLKIGIPKPTCVCGHQLRSGYKVCPNCGVPTEELKNLWGKHNLKKWDQLLTEKNGDLEVSDLSSKHINLENVQNKSSIESIGTRKSDSVIVNSNYKLFDTRIALGEEGLREATDEGWDYVGPLPENRYLFRRKHLDPEHPDLKND